MLGLSWKQLAAILCVLGVFLGLGWGVRQYGNSRVTAQELGTVKEAVSEAVAERKEAVKADAKVALVKARVADDMRLVGLRAQKELHEATVPDCTEPPDYSVLNRVITAGNTAITSTR